jgi:hypothetical protein
VERRAADTCNPAAYTEMGARPRASVAHRRSGRRERTTARRAAGGRDAPNPYPWGRQKTARERGESRHGLHPTGRERFVQPMP